MKLRVGNACWHAFHVAPASLSKEMGFFDQEGVDVEVVHARINPKAIDSTKPDGERYDEVGTVIRDMVAFGIDVIPDVHVRTPFAELALGNDELRIIGGWRGALRGTLVAAPGITSLEQLKGKRIGDWYKGGIYTMWYEHELRKVGIDPDKDIEWKLGYRFGSLREAWKPLDAGEVDASIIQNPYVPQLLEKGYNKLYDFVEQAKPFGRPDRVTVVRKSFLERNPEMIKRYWKGSIRGYQFMRITRNYPYFRAVEAKLRTSNPDPSERTRDLYPERLMEGHFFPLDGKLTNEGVWRILEEHKSGGTLPAKISRSDVDHLIDQALVNEAWEELSQTEEIQRNMEELLPVVERIGY